MKKWTAGIALIVIYRTILQMGIWTGMELHSIVDDPVMPVAAPLIALAAWIGFGFAARAYFRWIKWQ